MTRHLSLEWPDAAPFRDRGGMPIRILAVSDQFEHALEDDRSRRAVGPIDLIIGCGDLDCDDLSFLPDGGPVVIATDWIRTYPDLVAPWLPANRLVLGTDGFGRSDAREPLRRLFEIDPPHIAAAAMVGLARAGRLSGGEVAVAMRELGVDPDAPDPRSL